MIRVQPARQYQLRRACDRCHRSKLRCIRENDEEPCQRCLTAQVDCCSSPAARPQRQASRFRDGPNPNPKLSGSVPKRSRAHLPGLPQEPEPDYSKIIWNTSIHTGSTETGQLSSLGQITAAPRSTSSWSSNPNLFCSSLMSMDGVNIDMDLDLSVELAGPDNAIARSNPVSEPFPYSTRTSPTTPSSPPLAARPRTAKVVALTLASSHSRTPSTSISTATTSKATSKTAPSSVQVPSSPSPENTISPHPSDLSDAPSLTYCMRKLSDINITLMQHLNAIPEIGLDGKAADQDGESNDKPKYAIDEVFNFSQLFIDIVSHLLLKLPPPFQDDSVSSIPPSRLILDAASELVIFSSYLRLIETYDRILRHMQVCCHQGETHPASEYQLKLPGWSIGSFSIASKSKTQSLFMVHLIETMLTRSRDLVSELVVTPKATYGYRGDWECFGGMSLVIVPDLALQAIRTRERETLRLVQQIKNAFT